jgi:uncharacterized protein
MNHKVEKTKNLVAELFGCERHGHGIDHALRVYELAMKFAKVEKANEEIVALGALLHDVDDYKLFSCEGADKLTNVERILDEVGVGGAEKEAVFAIIKNMGYNKSLAGVRPESLEGKVVSDADMCDAMGAVGITRTFEFTLSRNGKCFDVNKWPTNYTSADEYRENPNDSAVTHMFERTLKLKSLMLTESGRIEAKPRHQLTVDFLREFFREQNQAEWAEYLEKYLIELETVLAKASAGQENTTEYKDG